MYLENGGHEVGEFHVDANKGTIFWVTKDHMNIITCYHPRKFYLAVLWYKRDFARCFNFVRARYVKTGNMISLQNLKVIVLFTLLITTFAFTMIPLALRACLLREHNPARRRRMKSAISLLNCFTAGVFIGTCLLDLFPEVLEGVEKFLDEGNIKTNFPVAQSIVLFGFLLLLIVEQSVTRWKAMHGHHDHFHDHGNQGSATTSDLESSYGSIDSRSHSLSNERTPLITGLNPLQEEEPEQEENEEQAPDPARHSVIRPLMLLTALSLHSIFEGLAIGLQGTIDSVLQIFLALTLHKCVVAFSIGLNNVQSLFTLRVVCFLNLVFSLMSPIGIGMGIGIGNLSADQLTTDVVTAVLQGIACGTFLYVVFMEILPHEFMARRNRPDRLLKVLCFLIGLVVVIGIIVINPDEPSA